MPAEAKPVRVLLISGSLRAGSTNSAVISTAYAIAPGGITAVIYDGLGSLPHFNPDEDVEGGPVHPAVAGLRTQLAQAYAVLFCTPEYAGGLPGSFKNLLDWTVGGGETYGMPVAWINCSGPAAPTGGADAHASLRKILGYTGSDIVDAACVRVPVARGSVGDDGLIADATVRAQIAAALGALAEHTGHRQADA